MGKENVRMIIKILRLAVMMWLAFELGRWMGANDILPIPEAFWQHPFVQWVMEGL